MYDGLITQNYHLRSDIAVVALTAHPQLLAVIDADTCRVQTDRDFLDLVKEARSMTETVES